MDNYIPLKKLIFEDNEKETNIVKNFTEYSHVLASVELMIYSFITAHPGTGDYNILSSMKRIRKYPLHQFSYSEEDALSFDVTYGMSRGL